MSSLYVRTEIKQFISDNLSVEEPNVVDLTADFENINTLLEREGITGSTPWIGLQFVGNEEIPFALAASNNTGKYRETGAIFIHIVEKASLGIADKILQRAEVVRDAFRGRTINDMRIESITPPNFSTGATLNFEGGYTSASIILGYERDLSL